MSDVTLCLTDWMARQRWYATKGRIPRLRVIGTIVHDPGATGEAGETSQTMTSEAAGTTVTTYLLVDDVPDRPVLYQVPIVAREAPRDPASNGPATGEPPADERALIGRCGTNLLYDGPRDPAYTSLLLRTIAGQQQPTGSGVTAAGHVSIDPGRMVASRVLSGEQSNTSIIYDVAGGPTPQVIAKVFRVLHHGDNPDVTTQAALSAHGSRRVPTSFGSMTATWPDPARTGGTATGHLAFVQEFLPGLDDAWRVALRAAEAGEDFSVQARDLGIAVAEVHATLAAALPTVVAGPAEIEAALVSMRRRIDTAVREVPAMVPFAERIRALYEAVAGREWPRLQRIHGDLHLGQALSSPERGWVLLDFEGEPMRPMPERSRPDVPLRDIAGMLRSFDYVSGSLAQQGSSPDARAWSAVARRSFVDGYIAHSGVDVRAERTLLDAFELDKAVYETIYETRNRPGWAGIPLAAVERLVARSAPAA